MREGETGREGGSDAARPKDEGTIENGFGKGQREGRKEWERGRVMDAGLIWKERTGVKGER